MMRATTRALRLEAPPEPPGEAPDEPEASDVPETEPETPDDGTEGGD